MSVDQDCSSEIAAMIGSSIALSTSNIPFDGPIAGVNVGRVDEEFVINPTIEEAEQSDLLITVAGTKDEVNMVEAEADEVSEDVILEAIMFGHKEVSRLVQFQEDIIAEIGLEKLDMPVLSITDDILSDVKEQAQANLVAAIQTEEKLEREQAIAEIKENILEQYEDAAEEDADVLRQVKDALDVIVKEEVRRLITQEKVRPDGRGVSEIRPLSSRVGLLPRTHGSGLFT